MCVLSHDSISSFKPYSHRPRRILAGKRARPWRLRGLSHHHLSWLYHATDRHLTGAAWHLRQPPFRPCAQPQPRLVPVRLADSGAHALCRRRGCRGADRQRLDLTEIAAGKFTLSIGDDAITVSGLRNNPSGAGGLLSISVSGGFAAFGRQSSNPQRRYRAFEAAKSRASAPSPLPYTEGEFRALTGREGRSQQITGGKAQ